MTIIVNLVIIGLLVYAAYSGSKRGFVLLGLELASFTIATLVALVAYQSLGNQIKPLAGVSAPLANVVAFAVIWIIVEVLCAITARLTLERHLHRRVQLSHANQIGGAVLGLIKGSLMIALSLIVFIGLPLSNGTKKPVTDAFLPRVILSSTGQLQSWLATGLGHDLTDSLNFFTVAAEPESEQRIDLGYTATGTVDAADETKMLDLINHERTTRGLAALTMNDKARTVARAYSVDMFSRGYFSHLNPEGKNPFDRMRAAGVKFGAAGENLALAPTLQLAHQGLMNSPGHRANILSTKYRTVGIGIIDGGPYGLMVTQDFTD